MDIKPDGYNPFRFLFCDIGFRLALLIIIAVALEISLRLAFPALEKKVAPFSLEPNSIYDRAYVITESEFRYVDKVNRQGFRDNQLYNDYPEPGVTRVLLLGDSFAYGSGLDYEQTWANLLEKGLNNAGCKVEIINTSQKRYSTSTEVMALPALVKKFHPHIVMLVYVAHDISQNLSQQSVLDDRKNMPVPKTAEKAGASTSGKAAFLSWFRQFNKMVKNPWLLRTAKFLLFYNDWAYCRIYENSENIAWFKRPLSETMEGQRKVTEDWLRRGLEICRSEGITFVVASVPQFYQYLVKTRGFSNKTIDVDWMDNNFGQLAKRYDFKWIPLLNYLVASYRIGNVSDKYYPYNGHLNPEGAKVVAEGLLRNRKLWLTH